jgi:hypothetical protein
MHWKQPEAIFPFLIHKIQPLPYDWGRHRVCLWVYKTYKMKKIILTGSLLLSILISGIAVNAQDSTSAGQKVKKAAKKTGKAISKGAKKVGNKTAELASKGSSEIIDKTYDGKTGPEGQKIFINDKSEYYWVDEKGKRHYVKESELKDKTE